MFADFNLLEILFRIFQFIVLIVVFFLACLLTLFRYPTDGAVSQEQIEKVFTESFTLIQNSDPILILILLVLAFQGWGGGSTQVQVNNNYQDLIDQNEKLLEKLTEIKEELKSLQRD